MIPGKFPDGHKYVEKRIKWLKDNTPSDQVWRQFFDQLRQTERRMTRRGSVKPGTVALLDLRLDVLDRILCRWTRAGDGPLC